MPYIRDFNPLIPQSVENIILKATAKRVEQRYASVDDMIDDLAHCQMPQYANVSRIQLENDPILSVKVEDGHLQVEQQKSRKKKRKWILAIGTAIFSLVVVSIVALFATGVLSFNGWLGTPIPKVVGLSSENAIALLEEAGLIAIRSQSRKYWMKQSKKEMSAVWIQKKINEQGKMIRSF